MNDIFYDEHDELYRHAKFGEDCTTRAGCRCGNMVFVCFFEFDAIFSDFFRRYCSVRCTTWFSFMSPGGATIFAKLPSKITKSPKIGGKVCAHHFV